ncbi:uncharacterized protein LOC143260431 isoform X2 [Megalopta genalis]|uniref:uncharacterized protein LOC143260430 isoform X2 n=1 Tax=Megalopta genalis TaxID=115081 RepID=UPI003FCF1FB4
MSCCRRTEKFEQFPCDGCCVNNCDTEDRRCVISNPQTHYCFCQICGGCYAYDNGNNCHSNVNTTIKKTYTNLCQCAEEIMWNSGVPPKPDCRWFTNFSELRRQWSNHARQQNCKCCKCRQR